MTSDYKGFQIEFRAAVTGADGRFFVSGSAFKAEGYATEALAKSAISRFLKANEAAPAPVASEPAVNPGAVASSNAAMPQVGRSTCAHAPALGRSRKQREGVFCGTRAGRGYRAGRVEIARGTSPGVAMLKAVFEARRIAA
jgi:hypothetical protein